MGSQGSAPAYRIVVAVAVAGAAVAAVAVADAVHDASCFARDEQSVAGAQTFAATAALRVIVCVGVGKTCEKQGVMCGGEQVVWASADKKRRY